MSYLDTSRGRGAGHLRENVHDRGAGAGFRHLRQRDLRADLLAVQAGLLAVPPEKNLRRLFLFRHPPGRDGKSPVEI